MRFGLPEVPRHRTGAERTDEDRRLHRRIVLRVRLAARQFERLPRRHPVHLLRSVHRHQSGAEFRQHSRLRRLVRRVESLFRNVQKYEAVYCRTEWPIMNKIYKMWQSIYEPNFGLIYIWDRLLVGLVVKHSAAGMECPGFNSAVAQPHLSLYYGRQSVLVALHCKIGIR